MKVVREETNPMVTWYAPPPPKPKISTKIKVEGAWHIRIKKIEINLSPKEKNLTQINDKKFTSLKQSGTKLLEGLLQ